MLGSRWKHLVHRAGGYARRRAVVVGVALHRERGADVSGERLELPNRFAALGDQDKAGVRKSCNRIGRSL